MAFLEDIRSLLRSGPMQRRYGGELTGLRFWIYVPVMLIFNPGVLAVGLYRLSAWFFRLPFPGRWAALACDRLNQFATGAQLPASVEFGPGLQVVHPQAVIIAPGTAAGRNLRIAGAAVTIGWADVDGDPDGQRVVIGDDVIIGSGAKVLGPSLIGDRVRIGPNAVLAAEDAPADSVVISSARTKVLPLGAGV